MLAGPNPFLEFSELIIEVTSSVSVGLNVNPLSANPTKWSNTLKQFVGNLSTCSER